MNACDYQLKVILHSYQENSSFLVYNKKDSCFYGVGNSSKLNKTEYLTSSKEVTEKIKQFVTENSSILDKKLLAEFTTCLEGRLSKLNSRTHGLLGIITKIYHVFNPQSKIRFKQQHETLKELKESVKQVKESNTPIKKIEPQEDFENEPDSISIHVEQDPHLYQTYDETSLNLIPKRLFPTSDVPNSFESPSHTKKGQSHLRPPQPPFKTPNRFFRPIFSPFKKPLTPYKSPITSSKNSPIPTAPTPPPAPPLLPLNLGNSTNSPPKPKLVPNEPDPLTFSLTNYKNLTLPEIFRQIQAIEAFIKNTENALEPLEDAIEMSNSLKRVLQDSQMDLTAAEKYLKQCKENLKQLEVGEKENKVVELIFKLGNSNTKIPFFPTDLAKQVLNESQNSDEIKKHLYSSLQLPDAIKQFQKLADYFEHSIPKLKLQMDNVQVQQKELDKDCLNNFGKNIEDLEKALEEKFKDLEEWRAYSEFRRKFREGKLKGANTPISGIKPKQIDNTLISQVFQKYKFLKNIKEFPQHVLLHLNAKNISGTSIKEMASDFSARLYGQLYAK